MREDTLSVASHILDKANQLHVGGFHEAAVVSAQSACEIACEWAIAQLLTARGADYLHACIDAMVGNYNLAGSRTRDLYVALSGDRVQDQAFWAHFTECVKIRNRVVHRGETVSELAAQQYIHIAKELIDHLEKQCSPPEASPPPLAPEAVGQADLTMPAA